ncbi:MAG TPA: hypothetical protein VLL52_01455 [Anaerolineae bacterium]|nr:hypothetical protein [Anaerolineae bacterium]
MGFLGNKKRLSVSPDFAQVGLSWDEFVKLIIELTIEAYKLWKQNDDISINREDNFTINLRRYINDLAYDKGYPITARSHQKSYTDRMYSGEQDTKEAKEIDLMMYPKWGEQNRYDRIHFVWEAKLVGDKTIDQKYSPLNSEYVNEAIYRFIRNEYAADVADAGVLGYVLAGNVTNIVRDINQSMGRLRKNPKLDKSNHLKAKKSPVSQFDHMYQSKHKRDGRSPIELHHLFLTFDF